MSIDSNVEKLVDEYQAVFSDLKIRDDELKLRDVLQKDCDWSEKGAEPILHLAKTYGSFVLRNALAVSLSLNIEDGLAGL